MRVCAVCREEIKGRTDKRFCSDQCRSTYHNTRKAPLRKVMRSTEQELRHNHRVLVELYEAYGSEPIALPAFTRRGFSFHRVTGRVPGNRRLFWVYNMGFRLLSRDRIRICREEDLLPGMTAQL